jgi:hypothetical protein
VVGDVRPGALGDIFAVQENAPRSVSSALSEQDEAFEWLERAYAQRDGGLTELKGDWLLGSLESDPRDAAFLKKMRLPL